MSATWKRAGARLERAVVGAAMVVVARIVERRLVRAVERGRSA